MPTRQLLLEKEGPICLRRRLLGQYRLEHRWLRLTTANLCISVTSSERPVLVLPLRCVLRVHVHNPGPHPHSEIRGKIPGSPLSDCEQVGRMQEATVETGLKMLAEEEFALYTCPKSRFHGKRLIFRAQSVHLRDDWVAAITPLAEQARARAAAGDAQLMSRLQWYRTRARWLYFSDDFQTLLAVIVGEILQYFTYYNPTTLTDVPILKILRSLRAISLIFDRWIRCPFSFGLFFYCLEF